MSDSLYRNSIYLIANTAVPAALTFGFWAVATNLYSSATVGLFVTVISSATLIASMSLMGFDYSLIQFIPGATKAQNRINTGLTISAGMSLVLGMLFLFGLNSISDKLLFLSSSATWVIGFLLLLLLMVWNVLTTSVFIAYRITQYALIASIVLGLSRFPLMLLLHGEGLSGLFLTQVVSLALCVAICFVYLYQKERYSLKIAIDKKELKHMSSYSAYTYFANVTGALPGLILPLILLKLVGPSAAAFFYIANLIAGFLYLIPNATSRSLFAEGNWDRSNLNGMLWKSAKLIIMLVLVGIALVVLLGWLTLGLFGTEYQSKAYVLLVLLSLTAIPKIASYIFSTYMRIEQHMLAVLVVATIGTIIQLGISIVGLRHTDNLWVLGFAAMVCEIFVAAAYTFLYYRFSSATDSQSRGHTIN